MFALFDQLFAPLMVFVLIHDLAQPVLFLGKCLPCCLCPLPKASPELRQGNARFALFNQFLGILIAGAGLQRSAEIGQCPSFLIQIKVGIAHAEVPEMVIHKGFLVGL